MGEYIRFFNIINSALIRKFRTESSQIKKTLKVKRVIKLEKKEEMWDITTANETFIANGLVSHNCYNSTYNKMFNKGKIVRYRSIKKVIEEAEQLKRNYPQTKYIFFEDDEFTMNLQRVREFNALWPKIVGLPFHVQLRIDLLTEERIALLKKAGCNSVTFAIESGNEKRRMKILGRNISNETILKGARLLHRYETPFRSENMVATPGETIKEALETLDLNIACKPKIGWVSLFQPYPKTALGDETIKAGLFDGNIDTIPQTFFERTTLKMPEEQKRKFENLQRLFGILCSAPALRPAVPFLINLPRNKIYNFVHKWWKNKKYDELYITK